MEKPQQSGMEQNYFKQMADESINNPVQTSNEQDHKQSEDKNERLQNISNNVNCNLVVDEQDSINRKSINMSNIKIINIKKQSSDKIDINANQIDIDNIRNNDQQNIDNLQQNKEKIIVLRNIHKTYLLGVEGVSALRGIDLNVYRGDFMIIYGASGGGKTSLLNVMGTIDKPTKGDLLICGHKIKFNTQDNILAGLRLSYLGFVFQTFNLVPSLNALENVELPMILQGNLTRSEIKKRAQELLDIVGLNKRQDHFPNQLSGGEQQRVTIARSLSNNPQILFLDEPTGDLDTKNTEIVMQILCKLNRDQGITMIMVTHDKGLKFFANRVIRMVDGRIASQENISKDQQLMAEKNLKLQFQNDQNNSVGVREGIYLNQQQGESSSKTQVRTPESYPALLYQLQK